MSWVSEKDFLPILACRLACLSMRISSLPWCADLIADSRFSGCTTVLLRGFGINPLGPSMRPSLPTLGI